LCKTHLTLVIYLESLFAGQAVSGPQNALLRHRALSLLYFMRS